MIGKLTGFVDNVYDDKCILDVNGVGYLVFVSGKSLEFLKQLPKDQKTSLIIEMVFKQDSTELYGFVNEIEKTWFLQFSKVQGVGSKMAQKILGSYSIEEICQSLMKSNSKFFTQIAGVGPKLANRIVTELKEAPNKLGFSNFNIDNDFDSASSQGSVANNSQIIEDAASALENLGYKRHDSLKALKFLVEQNPEVTLENLITSSLRELSRKKIG